MEEAHRRGVIHRDLKPSNIMFGSRREPVIMDFGLVWRIGAEDRRLTRRGLIVGTPAYMSPEQIAGRVEDLGPRCDIYSLGVILYELLTAHRPFEGPEAVVLAQILYVDPTSPSVHRPELDDRIAAICLKAMAKRPEDRYATMGEFASSLTDYLRREGRPPRPPGSTEAPQLDERAGDSPNDPHESTAVIPPPDSGESTEAPELEGLAGEGPSGSGEPTALNFPRDSEVTTEDEFLNPPSVDPSERLDEDLAEDEFLDPPSDDASEHLDEDLAEDEFPDLPSNDPSGDAIASAGPVEEPAPAANLWEAWDRWAAVVETIVLRPEKRRLVTPRLYERIYKDLIAVCRTKAATASREKRDFYRKLEGLVSPWLTPMVIGQTDRELLLSVLYQFPEIEQEIERRSREPDGSGFLDILRSPKAWLASVLAIAALLSLWLAWIWAAS